MRQIEFLPNPFWASEEASQVPYPLRNSPLPVTKPMWDAANEEKWIGFLPIDPYLFLDLFTVSEAQQVSIRDEAKPLEFYAQFPTAIPPMMVVNGRWGLDPGYGRSHEGRHRAAAFGAEYPDLPFWVGIAVLNEKGYKTYYEEEYPVKWDLDDTIIPRWIWGELGVGGVRAGWIPPIEDLIKIERWGPK